MCHQEVHVFSLCVGVEAVPSWESCQVLVVLCLIVLHCIQKRTARQVYLSYHSPIVVDHLVRHLAIHLLLPSSRNHILIRNQVPE